MRQTKTAFKMNEGEGHKVTAENMTRGCGPVAQLLLLEEEGGGGVKKGAGLHTQKVRQKYNI